LIEGEGVGWAASVLKPQTILIEGRWQETEQVAKLSIYGQTHRIAVIIDFDASTLSH
jgi:hypothetical protein